MVGVVGRLSLKDVTDQIRIAFCLLAPHTCDLGTHALVLVRRQVARQSTTPYFHPDAGKTRPHNVTAS